MADIKIGIMRECPQVMTHSFLEEANEQSREKKQKEEKPTHKMNFFYKWGNPPRGTTPAWMTNSIHSYCLETVARSFLCQKNNKNVKSRVSYVRKKKEECVIVYCHGEEQFVQNCHIMQLLNRVPRTSSQSEMCLNQQPGKTARDTSTFWLTAPKTDNWP